MRGNPYQISTKAERPLKLREQLNLNSNFQQEKRPEILTSGPRSQNNVNLGVVDAILHESVFLTTENITQKEKPDSEESGVMQGSRDLEPAAIIPLANFSTTTKDLSTVEKQKAELETRLSKDSGCEPDGCNDTSIITDPHTESRENAFECAEPAMSYDTGYIRIPRSLLLDPRYRDAPSSWQVVFLTMIRLAVWKETEYNDHGTIIKLKPGQLCFPIRRLAMECGEDISHKQVERAIKYFIKCDFAGQVAGQRTSVITIKHKDTYDLILNEGGTSCGRSAGQARDRKEEHKERKEEKKKEKQEKESRLAPAEVVGVVSSLPEKIAFREKVLLTQDEHDKALAKHGKELFEAMLDILDGYKTSSGKKYANDYGLFKERGWLSQRAKELLSKEHPITGNSSFVAKHREGSKLRFETKKDDWEPPKPAWRKS